MSKYSTIALNLQMPNEAMLFNCNSLYARLQELEDKRACRGRQYELAPLLFIALLAKLMGQNQLQALAKWAKLRVKELTGLLGLTRLSMPHKTTWGRVLAEAVDVNQLESLVADFLAEQLSVEIPQRGSLVLNIDGKTLRGTIPHAHTQGVHLMAAYLPAVGIVLAQIAVERGLKENEIVVAPKLLAQLDLRGLVVTGDAMQAQKALSVAVVAGGGDYVWMVKGNQPSVLKDIEILFGPEAIEPGGSAAPNDFKSHTHTEKGHGRIEKRTITTSHELEGYTNWPHLAQVFKLERWVWQPLAHDAEPGAGPVLKSYEVRYGITSLPRAVASEKRLMKIVRDGWGIENGLHHRRDVQFREDYSQLRRGVAPQVNAVLNNTALGLLLSSGVTDVAQARMELAYDGTRAIELLTQPLLSTP